MIGGLYIFHQKSVNLPSLAGSVWAYYEATIQALGQTTPTKRNMKRNISEAISFQQSSVKISKGHYYNLPLNLGFS